MKRVSIPIFIISICSIFFGFSADCQVPYLEKGIELYKQEKYEEAVDVFAAGVEADVGAVEVERERPGSDVSGAGRGEQEHIGVIDQDAVGSPGHARDREAVGAV